MKREIEQLINEVERTLKHKKEREILLGESFNVFSILGVEADENRTHSAFIGELLNPKGSHNKGNLFLNLFVHAVNYKGQLDVEATALKMEHFIGDRNDENKTGGRIDIFLSDDKGDCISIENKIYSGDQNAQIERYSNYHKDKNTFYYLTLFGEEPEEYSKGALMPGEDFNIISYKEHILSWLGECHKQSVDAPILRESIRQYIVLLKKLTFSMENNEHEELVGLMLKHSEASSFIAANFDKVHCEMGEEIRLLVIDILKKTFEKGQYMLYPGNSASANKFSQIWITLKEHTEAAIFWGVESFSGRGHHDGALFIGVFNEKMSKEGYTDSSKSSYSKQWNNIKFINELKGFPVNFSNSEFVYELIKASDIKVLLAEHIVKQIVEYLDAETSTIESELINLKR